MPLIPVDDQNIIKDKFAKEMVNPVNIAVFTQRESELSVPSQECAYCSDTRQLLEEISSLSDKIRLTVYDFVADSTKAQEMGVDKIPAVVISDGADSRVRYFGIPAGYEFPSLIEDIIEVSRNETKLSQDTKQALSRLNKDVHIQVFVTPT